jgi:hypothetical protein
MITLCDLPDDNLLQILTRHVCSKRNINAFPRQITGIQRRESVPLLTECAAQPKAARCYGYQEPGI